MATAAFDACLLLRLRRGKDTGRNQGGGKGKAEKIRDNEWRENYGKLFANKPAYADVHADVIALNRSLNPL